MGGQYKTCYVITGYAMHTKITNANSYNSYVPSLYAV